MDDNLSPGEKVFRNWELVINIFGYLPWEDICRLRNLSQETRYACQYCVKEVVDPKIHGIPDTDIYDFFMAMGATGCHKLEKIDLRSSACLSKNIGPLLKFCENIKYLGFLKGELGHDLYYSMIYNPDIEHLAIETLLPEHFQDVCLLDVLFVLPNLDKLEIPGTGITDIGLSEIGDSCPTLNMLNVSNCLNISDTGICDILIKCELLTHLNVRNTPTMQHCITDLAMHFELRHLDAQETHLTEDDALVIKKSFEELYRPYEFFYTRAIIRDDNKYDLIAVKERNREEWNSDWPLDYEESLQELLTDDFPEADRLSLSSETDEAVEITAQEYLAKLQSVVNEPYDNSRDHILNWAEKAFRPHKARFSRLEYRNRLPHSLDEPDDINIYLREDLTVLDLDSDESFEECDIGWRKLQDACKNVEELKEEYAAIVKRFSR